MKDLIRESLVIYAIADAHIGNVGVVPQASNKMAMFDLD